MLKAMKSLAMAQLDEHVARSVFQDLGLESIAFDMDAMRKPGPEEIAKTLEVQIRQMMTKFQKLEQAGLKSDFVRRFNDKRNELAQVWEEKWRRLCNGKQLLEHLRRDGHVKGDLLKRKKVVIAEMRRRQTEAYNSLDNMLRTLIGSRE